jgi:hypothetical protein
MGLMEDLGAWLDQKRRNVASSVQNPGLLYTRMNEDARQFQQDQRANWGDVKSVAPEVKAAGIKEFSGSGQEMAGLAPMGLLGWTAWHGSPHKFAKFDLSKIGTGEGAQAYGHGLYFAENPAIAKSYQNKLAGKNADEALLEMGVAPEHIQNAVSALKQFTTAAEAGLPWERAAKNAQNASIGLRGVDTNSLVSGMKKYADDRKGAMYKVDISDAKAPQDAFLQWDKPLSEQPKRVQDAMRKLGASPTDTGEQAYLYLQTKAPGIGAQDRYGQPIKRAEDYAGGLMRDVGIPGIRYLDGGSRGAAGNGRWLLKFKDGTSQVHDFKPNDDVLKMMGATAEPHGSMNTVLFDDSLVKILERNGQPLGLLGR